MNFNIGGRRAGVSALAANRSRALQQSTLFDNAYCSGTNSADGHAWSTQAMANDYLEREYDGYRTYPDNGSCSMAISSAGAHPTRSSTPGTPGCANASPPAGKRSANGGSTST